MKKHILLLLCGWLCCANLYAQPPQRVKALPDRRPHSMVPCPQEQRQAGPRKSTTARKPPTKSTFNHTKGLDRPDISFGVEVGSLWRYYGFYSFGSDFGIRYTRNFSPYFGIDFIKLKVQQTSYFDRHEEYFYGWSVNMEKVSFQLLTGVRFSTAPFGKNKNGTVYTAFRLGFGYFSKIYHMGFPYSHDYVGSYRQDYYWGSNKGFEFCMEWDAVMFRWKRYFLGVHLSYDVGRSGFEKIDASYTGSEFENYTFLGLRLGVDIGRKKSY